MKKSSLVKGLAYSTAIGAAVGLPSDAQAQEPGRQYNILADRLASREVLVNWDAEKGRAYIGTGIPVMAARDTLNLPEYVKGKYSLEIYDAPGGVKILNNQIITSDDVQNGIINGALVYRNPETGKIEESVRLLATVFAEDNKEKLSELERNLTILQNRVVREEILRRMAEERATELNEQYNRMLGEIEDRASSRRVSRVALDAGVGTSGERTLGLSLEIPFSRAVSAEFFSKYNVKSGDLLREYSTTQINERETQLIGPSTYKTRVDELTTNTEGNVLGGLGVGLIGRLNKRLELFYNASSNLVENSGTENAQSTISFKRNNLPLGEPETIENSREFESYLDWARATSVGARFNLDKKGKWAIGLSRNSMEGKKSTNLTLRRRF